MSPQVDFYLLGSDQRSAKNLLACKLVSKAYAQKLSVYLSVSDSGHAAELDHMLWTFSQGSFIPHTVCENEKQPIDQYPVLIGPVDGRNQAGRSLLINLGDRVPDRYSDFQRILEVVSAEQADKSSARIRFKHYKSAGVTPATHEISV